jgi:hypothetical protein
MIELTKKEKQRKEEAFASSLSLEYYSLLI